MTADPTIIPSSSSGGSTAPPTSPSRDSSSPIPNIPPSLSMSTSGSVPNTAPASPERGVVQVQTNPQMPTPQQLQPTMPLKPTSPGRQVQPPHATQMDSVVLGLQQLERQQAEQEQKRRAQAAQQPLMHDSEDDSTAPSSTLNSNAEEEPQESSIGRFFNNTRKRLSSRDLKASDNQKPIASVEEPVTHPVYGNVPEIASEEMQFEGGNLLICGYLHKLGRNGKWQRRFFETDGENLTYYKTSARTKCLATLDLVKVGDICVDSQDPDGCTFIIQVADRPYRLRADSQSSCRDWVITLNRVKEARMHVGRVQLVRSGGSTAQADTAPRVVLEANRQRTKAVDGENIHSWEDIIAAENAAATQQEMELAHAHAHATRLGTAGKRIQEAAVARWQKRQTSMQRLASRVVVWARSVNLNHLSKCTDVEDQVVLDHHVHPPGHDHVGSYGQPANRSSDSSVASQKVGPTVATTARGSRDEGEEEETREIS